MFDPRDPRDPRYRLVELARRGDTDAARELVAHALRANELDALRVAFEALGHARAADRLLRVKAIVERAPSRRGWLDLLQILRTWPRDEALGEALAFVRQRIDESSDPWPPRVRVVGWREWADLRDHRGAQLWTLARRLELDGPRLTSTEVARLCATPELGFLSELALHDSRVGVAGAHELAASHYLLALEVLELSAADFGDDAVRLLLEDTPVPRARRVDLSRNPLGAGGFRQLAAGIPAWPELDALELVDTGLDRYGAAHVGDLLARSACAELGLSNNALDGVSVAAIVASKPRLRRLELANNPVGDAGVEALVRSGVMARLETLDLSHCALSDGAVQLLAATGAPALRRLSLRGVPLGRGTLARLAALPALKQLIGTDGRSVDLRALRRR